MIKLHYFPLYGRAEPLRLLFHKCKLPWQEVAITKDEWPKVKRSGKFEFDQLPIVEMEGKTMSQTKAILRYIGSQHGFYPKEAWEAYLVDLLIDSGDDIAPHMFRARTEPNPDVQKTLKTELFDTHLPRYYAALERRIQQNSTQKFLVGQKLTIADMALAGRTFGFAYNPACPWRVEGKKAFDANPGLKTWVGNMEKEFADYLKQRPTREW